MKCTLKAVSEQKLRFIPILDSTVNWMSSHKTWGIFATKFKAPSVKLHLPDPELRPSMSSIHHSRPLSKSLQSFKIKLCQTIWHATKKILPSSTAHNLAAIVAPICTPSEDFSPIWRPAQSTDGGLMTCEACLDKPWIQDAADSCACQLSSQVPLTKIPHGPDLVTTPVGSSDL